MNQAFTTKQVIIMRMDLEMGKGKMVAQGSHASCLASHETMNNDVVIWNQWMNEGYRKIVLKVNSLEDLIQIVKELRNKKIIHVIVKDFGLTQLKPDTITALGIGPCKNEMIDPITKNLKLL